MKRIFKFLFGTNPNRLHVKSIKALSAFNETLETLKNINESATREVSKKATEIAGIESDIALLASIKTNNQKIIANIEKILN
jgi:predicted YcjX-like family ATPase